MVEIPTKEEIQQLPSWAMVALAARCARRVYPFALLNRAKLSSERIWQIGQAIAIAESFGAGTATASFLDLRNFVEAANKAADEAASKAASKAVNAAKAASKAVNAVRPARLGFSSDVAVLAAQAAAAAKAADEAASTEIRRDFELLVECARRQAWDGDTHVPPEIFGPMWPNAVPVDWPVSEEPPQPSRGELYLEIDVPIDADQNEVDRLVETLILKANALHRAYGGSGYTVEDVHVYDSALVPTGGDA